MYGHTQSVAYPLAKKLTGDLDLWPWKSIGFQILLRTKYVPSLVKIHWRMSIRHIIEYNEETDISYTYFQIW
jgi:hypothetical protein